MRTQGFAAAQQAECEQELSKPITENLLALEQMLGQQQWIKAKIAARMIVNDCPTSAPHRPICSVCCCDVRRGCYALNKLLR